MNLTKGPWKVVNIFNNYVITDSEDNVIDIRGNEDNAKLIAAAPELLKALDHTLSTAIGYGIHEDHPAFIRARKAIKKATEYIIPSGEEYYTNSK